jgi:hypothetical protein
VGRAIAALAADPQHWRKSGMALTSWDLSDDYGFSDADGRRPHWGRYIAGQVDAQWLELAKRAREEFAKRGVAPEGVVEDDRAQLMLRARVREGSSEWVTRPVLEPELFMTDASRIAAELYDRYQRTSSATGSTVIPHERA